MSDYALNITKRPTRGYDVLVALPLAFVTIFCFVFVMLHPYYKPQVATATAIVPHNKAQSSEQSKVVVDLTGPLSPLSTIATPPVSTTSSASQATSLSSGTADLSTTSSSTAKITLQQSSSLSISKLQAATAPSAKTSKPSSSPTPVLPTITIPSLKF